ncbi:hypothetical protein, partial [Accumulibacter sp.]|uniref:hypothetical protein n=1 Tax=Accumulibacter sp. TaxID=2053492 RepID=UPI002B7B3A1F
MSISISPMGCVLLQENDVGGLTDGGHDDSADMSVTSIDWMTFADCFPPFFDFWCELGRKPGCGLLPAAVVGIAPASSIDAFLQGGGYPHGLLELRADQVLEGKNLIPPLL